jgi:hypothetical protein
MNISLVFMDKTLQTQTLSPLSIDHVELTEQIAEQNAEQQQHSATKQSEYCVKIMYGTQIVSNELSKFLIEHFYMHF